jgi:ABC-type branched-subunit amino acid transport system substrate-binding protein
VRQYGDVAAGRRIELIVKDDATAPDQAKRAAQEMIVNDKVAVIGVGITPSTARFMGEVAPFFDGKHKSRSAP